ncbi:hypothetical protein ACOME3_006310 [Neoechinorhynchus agilis]
MNAPPIVNSGDLMRSGHRRRVAYFYDPVIGNFYYGQGHPMKPHRIRMTHNLVLNYKLYRHLSCYRPRPATFQEMNKFHGDEYLGFLRSITVDSINDIPRQLQRFNVGEDCPVFEGLYEFCQISAGGSVAGARKLNNQSADVAINWAGGMHHAKKSESSGFCYVNDIALAIIELLKQHQRVLYVDIDVHHGDGVEEAFYTTDRVMTVSFHKYGEYFPGTGDFKDNGAGKGKFHALNVPLRDGIDDETYAMVFQAIMDRVMETYQPGAVVLQCGSDSLTGDRLGCFNLSLKGHGHCITYMMKFQKPLLIVGGGGYTIRNVARCWAYETGIAAGIEVPDRIPYNDYYEYFSPDFKLHITPSNMTNQNDRRYLGNIQEKLFEYLRRVGPAPSVPIQDIDDSDGVNTIAEEMMEYETNAIDDLDPDSRRNQRMVDMRIRQDEEIDESDDDDETEQNVRSYEDDDDDDESSSNETKRPRLDDEQGTQGIEENIASLCVGEHEMDVDDEESIDDE